VSFERKRGSQEPETVKERNAKIEKYQPFEFNHINLLENVQNIRNVDDRHITMDILEN